jgi:hypothetical protein
LELRFFIDPETELPHIYEHGVTELEVHEVLSGRGEDVRGDGRSRMKIGQTLAGRYLQVIYVPDPGGESAFVITAYDLKPTAKRAFRRRQRRKGR